MKWDFYNDRLQMSFRVIPPNFTGHSSLDFDQGDEPDLREELPSRHIAKFQLLALGPEREYPFAYRPPAIGRRNFYCLDNPYRHTDLTGLEQLSSYDEFRDRIYTGDLYLNQEYRGHGVGTQFLMQAAEQMGQAYQMGTGRHPEFFLVTDNDAVLSILKKMETAGWQCGWYPKSGGSSRTFIKGPVEPIYTENDIERIDVGREETIMEDMPPQMAFGRRGDTLEFVVIPETRYLRLPDTPVEGQAVCLIAEHADRVKCMDAAQPVMAPYAWQNYLQLKSYRGGLPDKLEGHTILSYSHP